MNIIYTVSLDACWPIYSIACRVLYFQHTTQRFYGHVYVPINYFTLLQTCRTRISLSSFTIPISFTFLSSSTRAIHTARLLVVQFTACSFSRNVASKRPICPPSRGISFSVTHFSQSFYSCLDRAVSMLIDSLIVDTPGRVSPFHDLFSIFSWVEQMKKFAMK